MKRENRKLNFTLKIQLGRIKIVKVKPAFLPIFHKN